MGDDNAMALVTHKISHHEDHQKDIDFPTFIAQSLIRIGSPIPRPPVADNVKGHVVAVVDHSRWVVICPNAPVCRGADIVSVDTPVYVCASCGSPENGGSWYSVDFPADKDAIETELLERPYIMRVGDQGAVGRGWIPGQSIAELKAEREEQMGVSK